jgi:NDP-sugar pyrophosphorylase family protein
MMVVYRDARGELDEAGNLDIDAAGLVVAYQKGASSPLPFIDAGVSVWSREDFEHLSPQRAAFSLELDVFPALIARRQLWSAESPTRFYDIGTPERLAVFEKTLVS